MQTMLKKVVAALVPILIGTMFTVIARADCGSLPSHGSLRPQSWSGRNSAASLQGVSLNFFDEPIVGMWQVKFIAEGNVGPGLPADDAVIDIAIAQWHSDGTEIMNSSRNPATGSFCLGVWKRTGIFHFRLNHFAVPWNPSVDPEHSDGIDNIREDVILAPNGKTFKGSFTIDHYDPSGVQRVHITGKLVGTRLTADTPASVLF